MGQKKGAGQGKVQGVCWIATAPDPLGKESGREGRAKPEQKVGNWLARLKGENYRQPEEGRPSRQPLSTVLICILRSPKQRPPSRGEAVAAVFGGGLLVPWGGTGHG